MYILNSSQIKASDTYTIENEPVSSLNLMERASNAFTEWFTSRFSNNYHTYIFCGIGNNGGDGLAIARLLMARKYNVTSFVVGDPEKGSQDFKANFMKLKLITTIKIISSIEKELITSNEKNILIDGLFGTGLSRPLSGIFSEIVDYINQCQGIKIAIDIPSGLYSDKPRDSDIIINADHTLSFQVIKPAFLLPENEIYVGDWSVADIGLDEQFIKGLEKRYYALSLETVPGIKKRRKFMHKGNAGKVLLISGSFGKMGAAVLSAKACLKCGIGLLTVHAPECGVDILQSSVHEAMVSVDFNKFIVTDIPGIENYDFIGIGPGIGLSYKTTRALFRILKKINKPMVLDADALNIISKYQWIDEIPKDSILTPHPKEFERLVGGWSNSYERIDKQKSLSLKHNLNIVVKGAYSTITTSTGEVHFNTSGNPGMATAGSGDVLTGMVLSFLGQGYLPIEAVKLAVFLHGLAGDEGIKSIPQESLMAGDLLTYIPLALKKLAY